MGERKSIQPAYEKLQKTYADLPSYESLVAEFDLDAIAPDAIHIPREVAKKVFERTDGFRKILDGLLQPEGLAEMQDADKVGTAMNDEATALLRHLMRIDRELLVAELANTEASYCTFICDAVQQWTTIKPRLRPLVERLAACWQQPTARTRSPHYLG
jgi:hypothetical protein